MPGIRLGGGEASLLIGKRNFVERRESNFFEMRSAPREECQCGRKRCCDVTHTSPSST